MGTYKAIKNHFFMLDFCYFLNGSVLLQSLTCSMSADSGFCSTWFKSNFMLSHGPIAVAILAWQNSIVFHSLDKWQASLSTSCRPWHVTFKGGTWFLVQFQRKVFLLVLCRCWSSPCFFTQYGRFSIFTSNKLSLTRILNWWHHSDT